MSNLYVFNKDNQFFAILIIAIFFGSFHFITESSVLYEFKSLSFIFMIPIYKFLKENNLYKSWLFFFTFYLTSFILSFEIGFTISYLKFLFFVCFYSSLNILLLLLLQRINFFNIYSFTTTLIMIDYFRTFFLGGYQINLFGSLALDTIFEPLYSIFGEVYTGFVVLILILSVFEKRLFLKLAIITFGILLLFFAENKEWTTKNNTEFDVDIIQSNLEMNEKFSDEGFEYSYDFLMNNIGKNKLIVTPETYLIYGEENKGLEYYNMKEKLKKENSNLILGTFKQLNPNEKYNASIGYGKLKGQYYKSRLIPFLEYNPITGKTIDDLKIYEGKMKTLNLENTKFKMGICNEIFYSSHFLKNGDFDIFVVLNNNSDFGDRVLKNQHFNSSRIRSLEFQKPSIISSNTGISGFVNAFGKVTKTGNKYEELIISQKIIGRSGYTPYSKIGNWYSWLTISIFWLIIIVKITREKYEK